MFNLEFVSLVLSEEPAVILRCNGGLVQVVDQIKHAELIQEQGPIRRQFFEEILCYLQLMLAIEVQHCVQNKDQTVDEK